MSSTSFAFAFLLSCVCAASLASLASLAAAADAPAPHAHAHAPAPHAHAHAHARHAPAPSELLLDPAIRNWVLVPIILVIILSSLFRQRLAAATAAGGGGAGVGAAAPPPPRNRPSARRNLAKFSLVRRAQRLRTHGSRLPHAVFRGRAQWFCGDGDAHPGTLSGQRKDAAADGERGADTAGNGSFQSMLQNSPMLDPSMLKNMMGGQMAMMIPQMILMGWVSYFFSGFVCVKLPFTVTPAFKPMLQRGIALPTLDMSYVSSLSWYFLVLFGSRGIVSIILGETNLVDDAAIMSEQMSGQIPGQPQDFNKLFSSERENLELLLHRWELEDVEDRIMAKYSTAAPAEPAAAADADANEGKKER